MKKNDVLFWVIIVLMAGFYLLVGNDMYDERRELVKNMYKQDINISK